MTPPTKADRDALRALLAKGTPRPWGYDRPLPGRPRFTIADCVGWYVYPATNEISHGTGAKDDAALLAAAVNALPALLDAIDAAEEERARLRAALVAVRAQVDPEQVRAIEIIDTALRGTTGGGDGGGK